MVKIVEIKPVTRIEGHAKISIQLDEEGKVSDAHFHVLEIRGFERFLIGRPVEELPLITPRICGICHVAHHLASAKATDAVFGVEIPSAAAKLRELLQMGGYIHSHVLHFYALAAPDFVLGPEYDPSKRNLIGLLEKEPELVKQAIRARAIGQKICETVGGRMVHPVTAVPGGVSKGLTEAERVALLKDAKWALEFAEKSVEIGKSIFDKYGDLVKTFGMMETGHMGTVKPDGSHNLYDGKLRWMDKDGKIQAEFDPSQYLDYLAERVEAYSYLKFPYFKKFGWPQGIYRVNSLSRINVADKMETPKAQELLKEFRNVWGRPAQQTLLFHYARLIELIYAAEKAISLLEDKEITSTAIRTEVKPRAAEGVGVVEAPRGTLIHDYTTDENGIVTDVNLIVATVQNNPAMDMGVKIVAQDYIRGEEVREGLLNRVEMVVRAYDPCLSCATHATPGRNALAIDIVDHNGNLVRRLRNY